MIFKTIKDDATKSGEAITFLGRKISDIKDDLKSGKGFVNSLFGSRNSGISNDQLELINKWNSKIQDGCTNIDELNSIISNADEATQKYFKGLDGGEATLNGLAKATGNVSTGAKVAAKGIGLLKTTLNTLTSIGIMALVNLGMSLLQAGWEKIQEALKSTDEKIKELTQDLNSSLQEIQSISKEFQNLKSSADEVIPRFAELSDGVDKFGNNISLTDEEYQEFISLNNKIADMFPEVNVGLDSNGNAMLALSGNADTLTESLYALLEVQRQTANQKIADGFGDAFETAKKTANAYSTKREEIESDINPFNNLRYIIDNPDTWSNEIIAESGQQMSYLDYAVEKLEYLFSTKNKKEQLNELKNKYTGENGGIWWEFLFKDQEVQNLIDNTIDGYERQLHDVDVKVQSIWNRLSSSISAVLEQNPLYQSLDDELRNMTKIISAGVDPSQFDDDSALIDYIETNIISPLANLPKEVQKSISQIPDLQEQLKDDLISKEEFADKIKNVFAEIQDQTSQEQFNAFINAFVSGYNQMGIEGDNFIDVLQNLILYYIDCAKAGKTAEGATKSFIEVISNVQSLSNGLDKLASIYKDIQNQDDFDWSSILNNEDFAKQFENCGVVYTDFIKAISNSTTDIGSCQEAFNNLVTEYIYGSGVLDDLTDETKSATIAMLEQMGVVNASEVVEKNLYSQKEKNTKRFCGVLKQMAEAYPEIQSAADDYLSGLIDEEQLIAQLSDEYDTDEDNHYQYLLTKLNHEEDFIRASTEGSGAIVDYFAENYGVDLTNYKSYIGRKKALQADFDSSVAGGLTKFFNSDGSVTAEFLALTDQAKSGIQSIYEQYQNAIEDLDNLYEPVDFQFHVDFDDDSSSGLSKSAADTSKTFNWIEIAIEKVSKAASKLGNIVSNTFKSWTDRNNALKKQIKEVNKEIELQQQAYDVYTQKANSVGLPEYWANKVRNGSIDISVVTDEGLANKIDEFKEWYDKAQDCKDAIDELNNSLNDLYMTSFDNVVSKFDDILSEIDFSKSMIDEKISQSSQSSYSSFDKNQINFRKNIGYYEQLIAQEKKSIVQLEKEKAELTAILQLGIQNGTIVEGTEEWAKMRDQINDVTLSIEKANTSLLDYGESINKVYEDLFNNISNDFDNKLNEIQHLSNSYDTGISMLEAKGYLGSINFYTALQDSQRNSLDLLKQELASLEQAFAESGVEEFSDEWFEMRGKILDVNQAIREGELSLLEYAKAMREIEWEHFDYLQERISDITTEADFLIDLLDSADLYDDKGNFTDKGLATLGLHAQNYNVYMAQADKYYQEMLSIEKELASDPYNTDLIKRREELLELQQKSILAAEDEKQAMIDLAKSGIEAELKALKELIQAYTDALDSAKSLHDYQRKIADQTSEIASLEKQLLAYENDNSEEARATKQKIKSNLEKAKDDLKETEYERYISDQKELLDSLYAEYEKYMNQRLDNVDALLADLINTVNDNSGEISDTLSSTAREVGYELSDSMQVIWNNAAGSITDVVSLYGNEFSDKLTTVNQALSMIESNTAAFVQAANDFASQSVNDIKSELDALSNAISGSQSGSGNNGSGSSIDSGTPSDPAPKPTPNPTTPTPSNPSPSPGKTIEVGGKINAGSAPIYDYAGAPPSAGEKQVFANDPIYTVLSELDGFLKVRWHKLSSGVTGWFKKSDVKAYKTGGLVDFTGLAQLDGTPSKPEYVLNPDETKNFLALNETLKNINVKRLLGLSAAMPDLNELANIKGVMSDMKALQNSDFSTNVGDINITIPIDHVESYNDFVNQLKGDAKFEKMIQAMTVDRMMGRGSMAKNKFRW